MRPDRATLMMRFTMAVDGSKLDVMIGKLGSGIRDWSEAWPGVASVIYDIERKQFAARGRGPAGPWAPLSDRPPGKGYASRKARKHPGKGILEAKGALLSSVTGGPGSVFIGQPMSLTLGTTVAYAVFHQSTAPRTKLPRRPVYDFMQPAGGPSEDARAIVRPINAAARAIARRTGFGFVGADEGPLAARLVGQNILGFGASTVAVGEPLSSAM